jgi:CRISPR-associated protein Cmr1
VMRKPEFRPPEWRTAEARGVVEIVRTIEVVTPMFGGGVALNSDENKRFLKEPDRVTLVRGASVVGQVRFWWRALYGARLSSLEVMRDAEALLFGAASSPGEVALRLEGTNELRAEPVKVWSSISKPRDDGSPGPWNPQVEPGLEALAYGAFALQAKAGSPVKVESGTPQRICGTFVANWTVPLHLEALERVTGQGDAAAQLRLAVDAWLLFGGLGGRTRRGFGAVASKDGMSIQELAEGLRELDSRLGSSGLPGVPMVKSEGLTTGREYSSAKDAHFAALGALRRFRQGVGTGRNEGKSPNRPGRSFWPEAHAIRELTSERNPAHAVSMHTPAVRKFPRALFGMPIIFHFQGGGDPKDAQLVPEGRSRMASPLILRPISLGHGRWAAGCIFLSDSARNNLKVELKGSRTYSVDWKLTPGEANAVGARAPKLGIERKPTAHRAFIDFFKDQV